MSRTSMGAWALRCPMLCPEQFLASWGRQGTYGISRWRYLLPHAQVHHVGQAGVLFRLVLQGCGVNGAKASIVCCVQHDDEACGCLTGST